MWITDTKKVHNNQDMIHGNKTLSIPEEESLIKSNQKQNSLLEEQGAVQEEDGVKLDLSEQAMDMYLQQLEAQKDSAKAAGKAVKELGKLMEIARRIAKGDKVPAKDEQKLMEYSNDLYQAAKMSAMLNRNKKPKKHKSLFEEEENKDQREKLRALENDVVQGDLGDSGECAGSMEMTAEESGEEKL